MGGRVDVEEKLEVPEREGVFEGGAVQVGVLEAVQLQLVAYLDSQFGHLDVSVDGLVAALGAENFRPAQRRLFGEVVGSKGK